MPELNSVALNGVASFQELVEIENLLRCPICYELMETAMIIPQCSHNYCSLCIRRHITYKNQCPTCNEGVTVPLLRNNRLLDQLIHLFKILLLKLKEGKLVNSVHVTGTGVIQTNKKPPPPTGQRSLSDKSPPPVVEEPKSSPIKSWHFMRTPTKSRPTAQSNTTKSSQMTGYTTQSAQMTGKTTKPYQAIVTASKPGGTPSKSPANISEFDDDEVEIVSCFISPPPAKAQKENKPLFTVPAPPPPCLTSPPPCLTSPSSSSSLTSTRPGDRIDILSPTNSNLQKVSCPVCGVDIPQRNINLHLDKCLRKDEKKEALRSSTVKRKAMTKFVYTLMKDKELRKKVAESGLPTDGDRHTLIRRHQELTLRYNSECDSLQPKSAQELIKEILEAEKSKTKSTIKSPTSFKFSVSKGESAESVNIKQKNYVSQHKSQFSQLIADTKRRMREKNLADEKKKKNTETSAETVESADCVTDNKTCENKREGDISLTSPSATEVSVSSAASRASCSSESKRASVSSRLIGASSVSGLKISSNLPSNESTFKINTVEPDISHNLKWSRNLFSSSSTSTSVSALTDSNTYCSTSDSTVTTKSVGISSHSSLEGHSNQNIAGVSDDVRKRDEFDFARPGDPLPVPEYDRLKAGYELPKSERESSRSVKCESMASEPQSDIVGNQPSSNSTKNIEINAMQTGAALSGRHSSYFPVVEPCDSTTPVSNTERSHSTYTGDYNRDISRNVQIRSSEELTLDRCTAGKYTSQSAVTVPDEVAGRRCPMVCPVSPSLYSDQGDYTSPSSIISGEFSQSQEGSTIPYCGESTVGTQPFTTFAGALGVDVLPAQCDVLSAQCDVLSAQCDVVPGQCDVLSAQCEGNQPSFGCDHGNSQRSVASSDFSSQPPAKQPGSRYTDRLCDSPPVDLLVTPDSPVIESPTSKKRKRVARETPDPDTVSPSEVTAEVTTDAPPHKRRGRPRLDQSQSQEEVARVISKPDRAARVTRRSSRLSQN